MCSFLNMPETERNCTTTIGTHALPKCADCLRRHSNAAIDHIRLSHYRFENEFAVLAYLPGLIRCLLGRVADAHHAPRVNRDPFPGVLAVDLDPMLGQPSD